MSFNKSNIYNLLIILELKMLIFEQLAKQHQNWKWNHNYCNKVYFEF